MATVKFVVFAALMACTRGNPIFVARAVVAEPYDHIPQYFYGYELEEPLIGDSHGHIETRQGDVVKGSYALLDSDGIRRVVDYNVDPFAGFNTFVSKWPMGKNVVTAPAYAGNAAPLHSVPVASAPVVRSFTNNKASNFFGPLVSRIGAPAPLRTADAPWGATATLRTSVS